MNIRQLKLFVAVAEERNFGRAAVRLHMSQPPLSRQIKALEEDLGVLLFKRTPLGVELTQAGKTLMKDAYNINALVDQATERAQRAGRGQVGILDVGIFGAAIFDTIPSILSTFTQSHPEVKLVLHNAQTAAQIEAVRQGRVLLAFDRFVPSEPDLAVELVARESLVVALNQHNPLARKDRISICDLASEKLITGIMTRSNLADQTMALFHDLGIEPNIVQQVSDVMTAAALVASGYGTALIPASIMNLQLPNLVFRPLETSGDAFLELHCFYLRNEESPLLGALLDVVREFRQTHAQSGAWRVGSETSCVQSNTCKE